MGKSNFLKDFRRQTKNNLLESGRSYNIGRRCWYLDIPCVLNVYSSTITDPDGEPGAVIYAALISVGDSWAICRTLEEVRACLDWVSKYAGHNHVIFFTHNISRIFWFWKKELHMNGFLKNGKEPLRLEFMEKFEIRDYKAVGLYDLPRDPRSDGIFSETELEPEEIRTIEKQAEIMRRDIEERIYTDGGAGRIPLSVSGYTKRTLARNFGKKKCWLRLSGYDEYKAVKKAYAGGLCAANPTKTGIDITDPVFSVDLDSAYIAAMMSEVFPVANAIYYKKPDRKLIENVNKNYLWVGKIVFKAIRQKSNIFVAPIAENRAQIKGKRHIEAGRVVSADYLGATITSIDFQTIQSAYVFEGVAFMEIWVYAPGYLPEEIVRTLAELYRNKKGLKGIPEREYEYEKNKAILNSVYGFFGVDPLTSGSIDKYNTRPDRTTFYPWAAFVTAYVRRTIVQAIKAAGNDFVYTDTDSVKSLERSEDLKKFVSWYNAVISEKIYKVFRKYGIDPEGIVGSAGTFKTDGRYSEFKTLGAKKYIYREPDGTTRAVISGLRKEIAQGFNFDNFNRNKKLSAEESGAVTIIHSNEPIEGNLPDRDGVICHYRESGQYIEIPCEYSLDRDDEIWSDIADRILEGGKDGTRNND